MKNRIVSGLAMAALIAGATMALSQGALADEEKTFRVTIANATLGQPLAPGLVITHGAGFSLFEIGDAASMDLATMAETGDPGDLAGSVSGAKTVTVLLGTGGHPPLALPTESYTADITTTAKHLTAVGMLAATNDGFYAVRGVRLPKNGTITVYAPAYDAGSEANNETDGDVPASPMGNANDDGTNFGDGEGFIHIHNGIQGGADLDPAIHGWLNPVVAITIERLP